MRTQINMKLYIPPPPCSYYLIGFTIQMADHLNLQPIDQRTQIGELRIFSANCSIFCYLYISFRVLGLMTPHPFLEELFGYGIEVPP